MQLPCSGSAACPSTTTDIDHPVATTECDLRGFVKEEGRSTRNGYEASKGSKGISGL